MSCASETARSAAPESPGAAHGPEHEDDPDRDEDGLDDPSSDVADREGLVLPPRDRVEHNGGSDVGDDEKKLQEGSQVELVVLPATGDVCGGIVENRLEQSERRNRRDERGDEQQAEDPAVPLVVGHADSPPRVGVGVKSIAWGEPPSPDAQSPGGDYGSRGVRARFHVRARYA